MKTNTRILSIALLCLLAATACTGQLAWNTPVPGALPSIAEPLSSATAPSDSTLTPREILPTLTPTDTTDSFAQVEPQPTPQPTPQPEPTPFPLGNELTVSAMRAREFDSSAIITEETLANGANYTQRVVSYRSEGYKIYGLLTTPIGDMPEEGYPAIVFIHGYIPPTVYRTTERYEAYVDALARAGFVVFKIDLRGFGYSEGEPTGAYFSPNYTVDAITALKSLQKLDYVDPDRIGMWGHSMAGNITLRAMLVEPDVRAGVIWAGTVYSYDDLVRYGISDPSFRREEQPAAMRPSTRLREEYGQPDTSVPFWQAVSLTENIEYLQAPLQLHHAVNDNIVNIGYSQDLSLVLDEAGKLYEFYAYDGGGHNITSPYFSQAMQRTVDFFQEHLE